MHIQFKFTDTQRTKKSFEAFAGGLFGQERLADVWHPRPLKRDRILRVCLLFVYFLCSCCLKIIASYQFYKLCYRWSHEVDKNPQTLREQKAFRDGKHVKEVVAKISQRTGNLKLTFGKTLIKSKWNDFFISWNNYHYDFRGCSTNLHDLRI